MGHLQCPKFPLCTSLKTLTLEECPLIFEDDHFSSCLNLETLTLRRCYPYVKRVIKISAPRLVNLSLVEFPNYNYENDDGFWKLEISAPMLSSFCYRNSTMFPMKLSMDGCPILDKVDMFLDCSYRRMKHVEFLHVLFQEIIFHAKHLSVAAGLWWTDLEVSLNCFDPFLVFPSSMAAISKKSKAVEENEMDR
ncbi:f-box family protein [Corchorus capsularis]|uniref:F-box family protein n=1 Tax=Corchorus capsularis TaxID=210143 RepID=A0A1R3JR30_COCAP|nr:f-box family protein [Corchorus capsularis]